jgi:hypothetical protein
MRTKRGLIALLTCSAVAMGGLAVESAAAKPAAPAKHAKRCKILLVNGIHRCKGEHALKKISSSSSTTAPAAPAPVVTNVTINDIHNSPAPVPASTPAAAAPAVTPAPTPAPANPGTGDDGKPGKGPKDKHKSHPDH